MEVGLRRQALVLRPLIQPPRRRVENQDRLAVLALLHEADPLGQLRVRGLSA